MTNQDQIKILLAQKHAIDGLIAMLSVPRCTRNDPNKQLWVIFCDAPDQTGCKACTDRFRCREIFNKPKEA